MRTFLAIFGIMWGSFSIIVLLACCKGFAIHQKQKLFSVSNNFVMFFITSTAKSYKGYPAGRSIPVLAKEIMQLQTIFPIKYITPIQKSKALVFAPKEKSQVSVTVKGVSEQYNKVFNLKLSPNSRFFNKMEVKKNKNVVIIDSSLVQQLYPTGNAIGNTIYINQIPFEVIGTGIKNNSDLANQWEGKIIYLPYTTFEKLWGRKNIQNFAFSTYQLNDISRVNSWIKSYFAIHYFIDPEDNQAFNIFDSSQTMAFIDWFFNLIQIFFMLCGALTLSVGGVGVANIMFLIINQRAKEIGTCIALGAQDKHIMIQVLLETGLLVLMGGFAGFILSILTLATMHYIHLPEWLGVPILTLPSVLFTLLILSVVGLLAGFFPARRAMLTDPVKAMNRRG